MRGRAKDTIPAFQALQPDGQAAFRIGYVDPLIADAQKAAPGVNKARPLLNDAVQAEAWRPAKREVQGHRQKADLASRRHAQQRLLFRRSPANWPKTTRLPRSDASVLFDHS